MPIRYSAIFDGDNNVVGEFPVAEFQVLANALQKVTSTVPRRQYQRLTVEDTEINYHYLSNGQGCVVGCATTKDVKTRVVFNFLDSVEALARGPTADVRNLKKLIQQTVEHFNNNPASDKITAVQHSIDLAKESMTNTVGIALARGDHLDALHSKTIDVTKQAKVFEEKSIVLEHQMCLRSFKYVAIVAGGLIFAIMVVVVIACKPNFSDC